MNILGLDTSTEVCSVALKVGQKMNKINIPTPREHTLKILPYIDKLLKQFNISISDLNLVCVGSGPGSFTGIRVALGVAKGIAFGLNIPVVSLSSLEVMSYSALKTHNSKYIFAAMDARMNQVYFSLFHKAKTTNKLESILDERVIDPHEALEFVLKYKSEAILVGNGWDAYEELHNNLTSIHNAEIFYPDAEDLINLGYLSFLSGNYKSATELEALYIRNKIV